jgi:16S rRNA (adenine1518-N6/adenine1519-N6)-dimethyltransferase
VEIGPGRGALTHALVTKISLESGASLVCIERDETLATPLAAQYHHTASVRIVRGDVRHELPKLVAARTIAPPYAVVGNIPYYLTGYLLRILGELPALPYAAILTVQREVAQRMAALPPRMNLLAAMVSGWAHTEILRTIPRSAFRPPPRVESAVVFLKARRQTPPPISYLKVVRTIFRHPRKTVLNNLREGGWTTHEARIRLAQAGIHEHTRPGECSHEALLVLTKA